jgi:multiple sugar transport system permease protein
MRAPAPPSRRSLRSVSEQPRHRNGAAFRRRASSPTRGTVGPIALQLLMSLLAVVFITPILIMIVGAGKPSERVFGAGWRAFDPEGFAWLGRNIAAAVSDRPGGISYPGALVNSLAISGSIVVFGLGVNSLAGYALARLEFRGRRLFLAAVIALIIVPFESIALPLLLILTQPVGGYRVSDSLLAQILPFVAQPLYIFLFYSFFKNLPLELEEAAQIDGAGVLRTFLHIIVPLAGPAFAGSAILTFLYSWGQFLWPVMIASASPGLQPLPLGLLNYVGTTPNWGGFYAYAMLMVIPVVIVFLAFQRWFVQGVASTGLKG